MPGCVRPVRSLSPPSFPSCFLFARVMKVLTDWRFTFPGAIGFRLRMFRDRLARVFTAAGGDQLYFNEMVEAINEGLANDALFGSAEALAACMVMSDANELMVSDGIVYRI